MAGASSNAVEMPVARAATPAAVQVAAPLAADTIPPHASSAEDAANDGDAIRARPASLWRRVIAMTVDASLLLGVVVLYLWIAAAITGTQAPPSNLSGLDLFVHQLQAWSGVLLPGAILGVVLGGIYAGVFAVMWNGRTPGRWLVRIRLVDRTGHAPGRIRAGVRAVLSVVSFVFFLAGFWLAAFDRRGQTLHDKLTRTFVVQRV